MAVRVQSQPFSEASFVTKSLVRKLSGSLSADAQAARADNLNSEEFAKQAARASSKQAPSVARAIANPEGAEKKRESFTNSFTAKNRKKTGW